MISNNSLFPLIFKFTPLQLHHPLFFKHNKSTLISQLFLLCSLLCLEHCLELYVLLSQVLVISTQLSPFREAFLDDPPFRTAYPLHFSL